MGYMQELTLNLAKSVCNAKKYVTLLAVIIVVLSVFRYVATTKIQAIPLIIKFSDD